MIENKKILTWPHEILTRELEPVGVPDDVTKRVAQEITKALVVSGGLGLTACQIGYDMAMFSMWNGDKLLVVIDPKVTATRGPVTYKGEGCLSLPNVSVRVARSSDIDVVFIDLEGVIQTLTLTGLPARIFQHEYDHVKGKMILDYQSNIIRKFTLDKYNKKK